MNFCWVAVEADKQKQSKSHNETVSGCSLEVLFNFENYKSTFVLFCSLQDTIMQALKRPKLPTVQIQQQQSQEASTKRHQTQNKWTHASALLYSITLITTIGNNKAFQTQTHCLSHCDTSALITLPTELQVLSAIRDFLHLESSLFCSKIRRWELFLAHLWDYDRYPLAPLLSC